ncbi:hypothetical protein [Streptomyces carpinensis]|uniref:Secreted protein n=1 Tax=Streptomyces carpinensis TaxID=66369 RepID=A0ABV1W6Z0_9ACTN|nr:hypothetical protein [Streptomyces carpinensis]
MKPTTRGTLAAVVTGVAAAVGAATATPAAAVGSVPVSVPLGGAESALGMKLPKVGGELPVPTTGTPEGLRLVRGRLLPERVVPQVPVHGGLPGLDARAPLAHVLDDGSDHVGVEAPASGLRALAPGLSVDGPLTAPEPGRAGLPDLKLPELEVLGPVLQTAPGADLTAGPGL